MPKEHAGAIARFPPNNSYSLHPQICQRPVMLATIVARVYRDQRNGLLKAMKQRSLRLSHLDSVQVVALTIGLVNIFLIYQWKLQENLGKESGPEILLNLGLGNSTRRANFFSFLQQ